MKKDLEYLLLIYSVNNINCINIDRRKTLYR